VAEGFFFLRSHNAQDIATSVMNFDVIECGHQTYDRLQAVFIVNEVIMGFVGTNLATGEPVGTNPG